MLVGPAPNVVPHGVTRVSRNTQICSVSSQYILLSQAQYKFLRQSSLGELSNPDELSLVISRYLLTKLDPYRIKNTSSEITFCAFCR